MLEVTVLQAKLHSWKIAYKKVILSGRSRRLFDKNDKMAGMPRHRAFEPAEVGHLPKDIQGR